MSLTAARNSGRVMRWHTKPAMSRLGDTVAAHHGRVAQLIDMLHPDPSGALLRAALRHDAGEPMGDLPHDAKVAHPEMAAAHRAVEEAYAASIGQGMPNLTEREERWLKTCDRLDGLLQMHEAGTLDALEGPDGRLTLADYADRLEGMGAPPELCDEIRVLAVTA